MHITIKETAQIENGFRATLHANHNDYGPFTITNPLTETEEAELAWYFEKWLAFPFIGRERANQAAALIPIYGEALFDQLIAQDPNFHADYKAIFNHGLGYADLSFAIAGTPAFHALHWEALKDPRQPRPFALECPMVRQNLKPSHIRAAVKPSPTLNILLVTARPHGRRDVGYRTISRPLVEALRRSAIRANIELVRPGTYEALINCLEQSRDQHGPGHYHVIHFDLHGALMRYENYQTVLQESEEALHHTPYTYQSGYGRPDLPPYPGQKAFLFFDSPGGTHDPVADDQLAALLQSHQIPVAILNACQSGQQLAAVEGLETVPETSLGSRLMNAGVQLVVAMGYSISVTAAQQLMTALYQELFAEKPLAQSLRRARLELYNRKTRRGGYDQLVDLEDWLLPVVYQNSPVELRLSPFPNPQAETAYYQHQSRRYQAPAPTFGFVGRDIDILEIERHLLSSDKNILLIRGMGGAGKTTLLRHLMEWWQTTGLVREVCYFGYDERAHTLEQIIDAIGRTVYGEQGYIRELQPLPLDVQQEKLSARLRAERCLLVLDNLESITGSALAVQHTLPEAEQTKLRRFLSRLLGGKTLLLLGSRGGEEWLLSGERPPLTQEAIYDLPGLDPGAAADLAERILQRHKVSHYRSHPDHRAAFQQLLKLLDGYPLALEVVLSNLARQTPGQVLAALSHGDAALDTETSGSIFQDKTRSILRCIEYSHSNLSPDSQALLACLAPFSGVVNADWLPQYSQQLTQQPELTQLPFDRWPAVIQEAVNWGLLTPHEIGNGYFSLQPIFPYFLRSRLHGESFTASRSAIETAFHHHYDGIGSYLSQLIQSKDPLERQAGQVLITYEYDNLLTALKLALDAQVHFWGMYSALSDYLDIRQAHHRGIELTEMVLVEKGRYSVEQLQGEIGADFVGVLDQLAKWRLLLKQYKEAESSYKQALEIHEELTIFSEDRKAILSAGIYHQLGMVAEEQRQWPAAENYYQQALALKIEFNDRYSQAATYHQLGYVAQEQRQWPTAENYYQQALALFVEFNDRYRQASTYHQLGRVAEEQRQWPTAENYYQQALAIYIEFNDRYSQAGTYHQLGMVAQEQRQWPAAENYYQQALALKIEFNDRYRQASTYHNLGAVAQEQRQWPTAENYYQQALAIYIEFNDRYSQASTYHQLGMVAEEQEQWGQAVDYFLRALQIDFDFNDDYNVQGDIRSLGRIWQAGQAGRVPADITSRLLSQTAQILNLPPAQLIELFNTP